MWAAFKLAGLDLSLEQPARHTLTLSLRSVIPPGRRAVRAAAPARPGAVADKPESPVALTSGLGTGLPPECSTLGYSVMPKLIRALYPLAAGGIGTVELNGGAATPAYAGPSMHTPGCPCSGDRTLLTEPCP